jgi:UDP-2,3-diacylglucosamine hydrolase
MSSSAPALFISDLHLTPARPRPLAAFDRFAHGPARLASAVYVLGDLFDGWIGDEQLDDAYAARIAYALRGISSAGIPLHVARGTRDFLFEIGNIFLAHPHEATPDSWPLPQEHPDHDEALAAH